MSRITTLTKKNQITLPATLVKEFKLAPKDRLMVEKIKDQIKLTPIKTKSFLDLQGVIKSNKKYDAKKLRKEFIIHQAKKSVLN